MRTLSALLLCTAALTAQTPLNQLATPFAGGVTGAAGGAIFFDLTASSPVTWTGFDLDFSSPMLTPGSVSVWTRTGTSTSFETSPIGWFLAETINVTSAGPHAPTHADFTASLRPLLPFGVTGVAIVANGLQHLYSQGSGSFPACQLTLTSNSAMNVPFTNTTVFSPRTVHANIYYSSNGPDICAAASPFGAGCHGCFASYYEYFADPSTFTLANSSVTMVPSNGNYIVGPTLVPFIPPIGSLGPVTTLTLQDDDEVTVPLSGTFVGCSGVPWSALSIMSNGKVSQAPGNSLVAAPSVATLLNDLSTAFYCQGDWDPSAGGSVSIEQGLTITIVTWQNVPSWNVPNSANTFQMQFLATGVVHLVFGTMAPTTANGGILVGYSPGGSSLDPGPTALASTLLFSLCCDDARPMSLSTTDRPIQPSSGTDPFDLITTNIDPAAVLHLGVLGLTDLGTAGWPLLNLGFGPGDCQLYCQPDAVVMAVLPSVTSWSWTAVTLFPPGIDFRNLRFCAQALTLNPGAFSVADRASNALACKVGNR